MHEQDTKGQRLDSIKRPIAPKKFTRSRRPIFSVEAQLSAPPPLDCRTAGVPVDCRSFTAVEFACVIKFQSSKR
jgi:hypothetical protein